MKSKAIFAVIIVLLAVTAISYVSFFSTSESNQSPEPVARVQSGECPQDGRFENSTQRVEEVYNDQSIQERRDEVLRFVAQHPILCDIGSSHQLVIKVPQTSSVPESFLSNSKLELYLKNLENGKETLIPSFQPNAYGGTYSFTSLGMEGIWFEVRSKNVLDLVRGGLADAGGWVIHTLVHLDTGQSLIDYTLGSAFTIKSSALTIKRADREWRVGIAAITQERSGGIRGVHVTGVTVNDRIVKPLNIERDVDVSFPAIHPCWGVVFGDLQELKDRKFSAVRFNDDFSQAFLNAKLYFNACGGNYETIDLGEVAIDLE